MGKCWDRKDVNYRKLRNRIAAEIREHQLAVVQQSSAVAEPDMQVELRSMQSQIEQVHASMVQF